MSKVERSEALAQFAQSARQGQDKRAVTPTATKATQPISPDPIRACL